MRIWVQNHSGTTYTGVADETTPTLDVPMLPHEQYTEWQNGILQSNPNVYRVRRWGDPIMKSFGFTTTNGSPANFQAIGLFNKANNTVGGVSNYLRVPVADFRDIAKWQPNDEYLAKRDDYQMQKLGWLTGVKGTIYFWFHSNPDANGINDLNYVEWGTIQLGGNLVTVDNVETLYIKIRGDQPKQNVQMARLRGFRKTDWDKPLIELLSKGLVSRCFCVYRNDVFGDSPKGIVYSPFWSPVDWTFIGPGQTQPDAFYVPMAWLTK